MTLLRKWVVSAAAPLTTDFTLLLGLKGRGCLLAGRLIHLGERPDFVLVVPAVLTLDLKL